MRSTICRRRRFADVGLNVDLKHVGCERALLDGLRDARLTDRTVISSQVPAVLDRVARARAAGSRRDLDRRAGWPG